MLLPVRGFALKFGSDAFGARMHSCEGFQHVRHGCGRQGKQTDSHGHEGPGYCLPRPRLGDAEGPWLLGPCHWYLDRLCPLPTASISCGSQNLGPLSEIVLKPLTWSSFTRFGLDVNFGPTTFSHFLLALRHPKLLVALVAGNRLGPKSPNSPPAP